MDVFDIYPRQVNPVLFEEAYLLHKAAGETYRQQNKPVPVGRSLEQNAQRNSILKIASQLMVLERDKLLDRFCVDWLKFRDIPIPEKDHASSSLMGVQGPQGTDGPVRSEGRGEQGGPDTLHNRSIEEGTQPTGGQSVP